MKLSKLVLLALFTLLSIRSYAQINLSAYVYAYASEESANEILIHYLDPETSSPINYEISISKPSHQSLIYASPSPDGQWIVFLFGNTSQHDLILYNMINDSQKLIAQLSYDYDSPLDLLYPKWSPDSQKIAFFGSLLGSTEFYLHSYRVDFDSITSYSLPNEFPSEFAWSPDSRYLSEAVSVCETQCRAFLHTIDVVVMEYYNSIEMEIVNVPPCQLRWSPDSQHIAYRLACDFPTAISFSEIFVWNVAENSTTQITQFTNSIYAETLETYATSYELLWYDEQTFFLAAGVSQPDFATGLTFEESFINQTQVYKLPSASPVVFQNSYLREWAKNPLSNELAYLNESLSLVNGEYQLDSAALEIANYSGESLEVVGTYPAGCELAWSADGAYLSYEGIDSSSIFAVRDCEESQRFIFVNNASQEMQIFDSSNVAGFVSIGWILMPE
jgi:hypothetical protein